MLCKSLQDAIYKIQKLIELTELDIQNLTNAENDLIFQRLTIKETLIKEFEQQKKTIDSQMLNLKRQNPNQELSQLLGEEVLELLEQFKQALRELKRINSGYARSVYAVGEFYTSLLRKIVPHEQSGYGGYTKPQKSFLTIQV